MNLDKWQLPAFERPLKLAAYALLGHVVSRVSGMPFRDYVRIVSKY